MQELHRRLSDICQKYFQIFKYIRHSAQARADALLASLHDGTEDGKRARARLLSCACGPSSAWLDTLPLARAPYPVGLCASMISDITAPAFGETRLWHWTTNYELQTRSKTAYSPAKCTTFMLLGLHPWKSSRFKCAKRAQQIEP
jgi:hypothetical protein